MPKALNLIGQKYGRLTVLEKLPDRDKYKKVVWKCICDCGETANVNTKNIRTGNTTSCGCYHKELITKHGMTKSRAFRIWSGMRTRCLNKNSDHYQLYGGRGITIDSRWNTFAGFYKDMGDPPKGMTLDRKDNDDGYCKSNCRWATSHTQAVNRRSTRFITYQNETKSISDWARSTGVRIDTLHYRFAAGWSVEKALTTPVKLYVKNN